MQLNRCYVSKYRMLGVELIAIKSTFSPPSVVGSISTLVYGNISKVDYRLRENIQSWVYCVVWDLSLIYNIFTTNISESKICSIHEYYKNCCCNNTRKYINFTKLLYYLVCCTKSNDRMNDCKR